MKPEPSVGGLAKSWIYSMHSCDCFQELLVNLKSDKDSELNLGDPEHDTCSDKVKGY